MTKKETCACIVLAAGASSRMGRTKQLLELRGQPLVARACCLANAAGFDEVVVVTGAKHESIVEVLPAFAHVARNTDWQSGMGSSVYTGLSYVLEYIQATVMAGFILTDQPFLSANLLRAMLYKLQQSEAPGIAARYNNTLGTPALFRSPLFPELLKLRGEKGAKPLLAKYRQALLSWPFPQGGFDLDYPEDWEQFLAQQ